MRTEDLKSYFALLLLAGSVFYFREDRGSLFAYVSCTVIVVIFWFLNELKLGLANMRNILLLVVLFGSIIVAVRTAFPTNMGVAKMGSPLDGELNPAKIAQLKESHEIAIEIYLEKGPSSEERYYRTDILPYTMDGMHYSAKPLHANTKEFPLTATWVHENVQSADLQADLQIIKDFFTSSLSYSLSPGQLKSQAPLDEFLFTSKMGFCEHFAAGLSTLLTQAGYRARVSVGYAGGRWNPMAKLLSFEDADAHAWVEVQNPKSRKWQIVDPTLWITSVAVNARSDFNFVWISFIAFLIAGVLGFAIFFGRTVGAELLLQSIEKLERKNRLSSQGLVVSERLKVLMEIYPDLTQKLNTSLLLYYRCYFSDRSNPQDLKDLTKSIRSWI